MIRVLLVDDQPLFVESLRKVLESAVEDIEVIGIAGNGRQAVTCAEEKIPDIILMDVRMPEMDGVEATHFIHQRHPGIRIIMLTTFDDDEYVRDALNYGAIGYLLKDIAPDDLIKAIRLIKNGSFLMARSIAERLVQQSYFFVDEGRGGTSAEAADELSKKERQILRLIAKGFDNTEIAVRMYLATQTVKNYVSRIYAKLGVHDRAQAIKAGIEMFHSRFHDSVE